MKKVTFIAVACIVLASCSKKNDPTPSGVSTPVSPPNHSTFLDTLKVPAVPAIPTFTVPALPILPDTFKFPTTPPSFQ